MIRDIIIGIWGLCIGLFVAAGVCALLTSVGVITRLAWKTKTDKHIRLYENCILAGTTVSNIIYIYGLGVKLTGIYADIMLSLIGILFGIFVGCLAMSLAEALDGSTIAFRRISLVKYTRYVILSAAIGKLIGNMIYFCIR